jgi:hypothetical protein
VAFGTEVSVSVGDGAGGAGAELAGETDTRVAVGGAAENVGVEQDARATVRSRKAIKRFIFYLNGVESRETFDSVMGKDKSNR